MFATLKSINLDQKSLIYM